MQSPDNPSLQPSLAAKAGRLSVYQLGQRLIDFGVTIVLARLLAPADFGVVAAAIIFIQLAQLVVEIGIGATIVQAPQLSDRDLRVANTLIWVNAVFYFVLTQLLASWAAIIMGSADVEYAVRVLAFTFLAQAIGIVSENLLIRKLEAVRVARLQLIVRLVFVGMPGVALAASGWSYWALVISTLAGALARAVWTFLIVRPPVKPLFDHSSAKRLLRKGAGFSASRVINFVAIRGDNALVGHLFSPTVLGIYSRAYNLMNLPADLYGTIAERLIFPALAKVQDNPERLRTLYLRGIETTALVGLPLSVILFIFGPEWIRVVLGPKWVQAIQPFQILVIATYFRLGMKISGSVQRAKGSVRAMVGTQVVYATLVVGGCILAYPYGLLPLCAAVSLGVVLAYAVITWSGLIVTGTSLRDYVRSHRAGMLLALCTAAIGLPIALGGRHLALPSIVILATFLVAAALLGAVLIKLRPQSLLGQSGVDMAAQIEKVLRKWSGRV
jgi:PST family polysaccharide transporter